MRPASPYEALSRPVTTMLVIVAVGVSLAFFDGAEIDALEMGPQAFVDEPWRLVTSIFPHADFVHLLFNVFWTWTFGVFIERRWGHLRILALVLFLAVTSSAAQYAGGPGGIGLSGVGYGLLGFLWATRQFDRRHPDAMDEGTLRLFLLWGVLCVVLTAGGVWSVANVAHASGMVFGYGIGCARAAGPRGLAWLVLGALGLLVGAAATVARPWLAVADRQAQGHCYLGFKKLEDRDPHGALAYLESASHYPEVSTDCLYNYRLALEWVERDRILSRDEPPPQASVRGQVVDAQGAPLKAVILVRRKVTAEGALGWRSSDSGPDGRFFVKGLEPGAWEIVASAPGFAAQAADFTMGGEREPIELTIVLTTGSTIEGVVLDSQGRPSAGQQISVLPHFGDESAWAHAHRFVRGTFRSGADGTFRIVGVNPGLYELTLVLPGEHADEGSRVLARAGGKEVVLRSGGHR